MQSEASAQQRQQQQDHLMVSLANAQRERLIDVEGQTSSVGGSGHAYQSDPILVYQGDFNLGDNNIAASYAGRPSNVNRH